MIKQDEYMTKDLKILRAKQELNKIVDEVIETGTGAVEVRIINKKINTISKTQIYETESLK